MCLSSPSRLGSPPRIASPCGFRVKKTLSTRTHVCPQCGLVLDRDENAALNILAAAPLGSGSSPYRRAGGNGFRFAGTNRFGTDRHDALCSQEHEALGLDERRIPRRKLRGVSIVDEWIEAIGSGLNFERKQLLALMDRIIAGEIGM